MLEALLDSGIVPDLLVGTSIGAVNAAFMAAGPTPERARMLSNIWRRLSVEEFFPLRPGDVTRSVLSGAALFSQAPLRRLLEREIPFERLEDAATPLFVVATRCERDRWVDVAGPLRSVAAGLDRRGGQGGDALRLAAARLDRTVETAAIPLRIVANRFERRVEEVFRSGPVLDALLASTALPLVFPPYRLDGTLYVDGGLSEYVPLGPALLAGAGVIYILSVQAPPAVEEGQPPRSQMYRAVGSRFWRRLAATGEAGQVDLPGVRVVQLPMPAERAALRDFSRIGDLIDGARDEVLRFLSRASLDQIA